MKDIQKITFCTSLLLVTKLNQILTYFKVNTI